jgi:hypothetical protein
VTMPAPPAASMPPTHHIPHGACFLGLLHTRDTIGMAAAYKCYPRSAGQVNNRKPKSHKHPDPMLKGHADEHQSCKNNTRSTKVKLNSRYPATQVTKTVPDQPGDTRMRTRSLMRHSQAPTSYWVANDPKCKHSIPAHDCHTSVHDDRTAPGPGTFPHAPPVGRLHPMPPIPAGTQLLPAAALHCSAAEMPHQLKLRKSAPPRQEMTKS